MPVFKCNNVYNSTLIISYLVVLCCKISTNHFSTALIWNSSNPHTITKQRFTEWLKIILHMCKIFNIEALNLLYIILYCKLNYKLIDIYFHIQHSSMYTWIHWYIYINNKLLILFLLFKECLYILFFPYFFWSHKHIIFCMCMGLLTDDITVSCC